MSIPLSVPDRAVLTSGTGRGDAKLTAFDSALHDAGIHNANIVEVSSIIPRDAELSVDPGREELVEAIEVGALQPMVVSKATATADDVASETPLTAAIGAGWLEENYGLNVEAHGVGTTPEDVRDDCEAMLSELAETRGVTLESTTATVASETVPDSGAVAAIAACVYL